MIENMILSPILLQVVLGSYAGGGIWAKVAPG
jgi:hypothetical protein